MIKQLLMNQNDQNKIAVIGNGKEVRYHELIQKAFALQCFLPQNPDETVAVFLPNSADYLAAFWGVIWSGRTVFPLNVLMKEPEVTVLLNVVSVDTIITSMAYRDFFEGIAGLDVKPLKLIYIDEITTEVCESDPVTADISEEKAIVLLSTSGTTGNPKIVQLSSRNIEASVKGFLKKVYFDPMTLDDIRFVLAVPFSSIFGIMILSACLIKSFPIVLLNDKFTLNALFRTVEKHRVTHYEGSASIIQLLEQLAGRPVSYDISSLRYIACGGSVVSDDSIEKVTRLYPEIGFFNGYGMTEASPLITKHPPGKLKHKGAVGTAIDGMEITIMTEDGAACPCGAKGEIVVKGPNVMLGYYKNKEETDKVLKNGYLYTGDIGYLDEDGYLYICGRKKNIIIVRGYSVYPEEVEVCIKNSRLVQDCFVYGQMDDLGNEAVCAEIVPVNSQVSEEMIREYCSTHLTEYKRPQKIYFCKSIEKNVSGKTKRGKGYRLWT